MLTLTLWMPLVGTHHQSFYKLLSYTFLFLCLCWLFLLKMLKNVQKNKKIAFTLKIHSTATNKTIVTKPYYTGT